MIEAVTYQTLKKLLPLVGAYQKDYRKFDIIDNTRNRNFYAKFSAESEWGCVFMYLKLGRPVGFATVHFSHESSTLSKVGVMNDLYTSPKYRGEGIGKELITRCREHSINCGATHLQWKTNPMNFTSQMVYDNISLTKTHWISYTL